MTINYLSLAQFGNYTIPHKHDVYMETGTVLNTGLNFAGTMLIQFTWAYLGLSMDNFFITGNLATTIMAGQIGFAATENTYPEVNFCYATSIALLYLFTSIVVWMFIYGVWCVLENTCGLPGTVVIRRWLYLGLGYGLPWLAVIPISLIFTAEMINEKSCWLRGPILWIFMGPLYFVCGFNFLVLVFLLIKRWRRDNDKEKKVKFNTKVRRLLLCFLAEAQPLGFFWIFGLVPATGTTTLPFSWIFIAVAGPQNLYMFFLFYCTNKTVLSLLASHYEDTVAATLKEIQKRKAERGGCSSSYDDSD